MNTSPIEGIVENGQIRLLDSIVLPENTKVYVVVRDSASGPMARIFSPRLVHPEQARDFVKQVTEVSGDAEL